MDHLKAYFDVRNIQPALLFKGKTHFPRTKDDFHRFPELVGWKLLDSDNFKLVPHSETPAQTLGFGPLLQAWLYFGLISSIVQDADGPILDFDALCNGDFLSTKELPDAIEKWIDWELKTPKGRWMRLIQTEYVLTKARHVVRQNCSCRLEDEVVADHRTAKGDLINRILVIAMPSEYSVKKGDPRHLNDNIALSLMVVGEFLSAAKSRIIQRCKSEDCPTGWHGDDDAGWGPPRYVLARMISDKWCPRAIFLLKGLLRSSATLLLLAFATYQGRQRMHFGHGDCDKDACREMVSDGNGNYANLCLYECPLHEDGGCEMVGPDMDSILRILDSGGSSASDSIPLIRFDTNKGGDPNTISFTVEAWRPETNKPFATISHVWSDGWGNPRSNTLRTCQLRFLRRQIRRANGGKDIPFWMDTLIVPVKDVEKDGELDQRTRRLKTKAIGQIFKVFAASVFTVILDNGLMAMPPGDDDNPAEAAMKILASAWMRRLWTLHEAFLSKKRYVAFHEEDLELEHNNLLNLETLREKLARPEEEKSPVSGWVRELLLQSIMEKESKIVEDLAQNRWPLAHRQAAMLVAGTWRAARWRTTSNAAHETLALATLLDVDYRGTEIEEAGLTLNAPEDKKNRLVRDFWRKFHVTYQNCIPAGIIFLPGEKVQLENVRGYGWAPKTWMSAHEVDFPDPLSRWTTETNLLEGEGLMVQYPGFILSTDSLESRRQILAVRKIPGNEPTFTFPVDSSLLEWYSIKPADLHQSIPWLEGIVHNGNRLAIILSRPQPKAAPREIGLLVEIYRASDDRMKKGNDDAIAQIYHCQTIRRVHVWRETRAEYLTGPGANGPQQKGGTHQAVKQWQIIGASFPGRKPQYCIGGALSTTQKWVVDGYVPNREWTASTQTFTNRPLSPEIASAPIPATSAAPATTVVLGSSEVVPMPTPVPAANPGHDPGCPNPPLPAPLSSLPPSPPTPPPDNLPSDGTTREMSHRVWMAVRRVATGLKNITEVGNPLSTASSSGPPVPGKVNRAKTSPPVSAASFDDRGSSNMDEDDPKGKQPMRKARTYLYEENP